MSLPWYEKLISRMLINFYLYDISQLTYNKNRLGELLHTNIKFVCQFVSQFKEMCFKFQAAIRNQEIPMNLDEKMFSNQQGAAKCHQVEFIPISNVATRHFSKLSQKNLQIQNMHTLTNTHSSHAHTHSHSFLCGYCNTMSTWWFTLLLNRIFYCQLYYKDLITFLVLNCIYSWHITDTNY